MSEGRERLKKSDQDIICTKMTSLGFDQVVNDDYIGVWHGSVYVCGFQWVPAVTAQSPRPAHTGHWQLNLPIEVHSVRDFDSVIREILRVKTWREKLRESWTAYHQSKSDKRWRGYRSYLAAILTGQVRED